MRFLATSLAVAIAATALVVFPGSAAQALPVDEFREGCGDYTALDYGGWNRRDFGSTGTASPSSSSTVTADGGEVLPISMRLYEPCDIGGNSIRIPYGTVVSGTLDEDDGVGVIYWGGEDRQPNPAFPDPAENPASYVRCLVSGVEEVYNITAGGQFSQPASIPGIRSSQFSMGGAIDTAACDEILEIRINIFTTRYIPSVDSWSAAVFSAVWSSADYQADKEYELVLPPEFEEYCDDHPDALECVNFTDPDPITWGDTCGDPNNADVYGIEWAEFNPISPGEWSSWMAACLFVPLDGFDRNGEAAAAWADSPNSELAAQLLAIPDAFAYAPACGPLVEPGDSELLENFAIDTCGWTWAQPIRDVLGIGVLVGGLWWFLSYIVTVSAGVLTKKVPNPTEKAK